MNFENHGRVEVLGGILGLDGTLNVSGTFHIASNARLLASNSYATLLNGARFEGGGWVRISNYAAPVASTSRVYYDSVSVSLLPENDGTLYFSGNCNSITGYVSGTGAIQIVEEATFSHNSLILSGHRIVNAGLIKSVLNSGVVLRDGSVLLNEPSGVVEIGPGSVSGQLGSQITNRGVFRKTGSSFHSMGQIEFFNEGILQMPEGYLQLGKYFVQRPSGSLEFSGGELRVSDPDGLLTNEGTITCSTSADKTMRCPVLNSGLIELTGGKLTLASDFDQEATGEIRIAGGSLETPPNAALTVAAGRLTGSGVIHTPHLINNGAAIEPQNGLKLIGYPNADYTQSPSATLAIDIAGPVQQSDHDVLKVSGIATLGGTLRLIRSGDYLPAAGETFTILECDSRIGRFEQIEIVGFPKGSSAAVKYFDDRVVVAFKLPN